MKFRSYFLFEIWGVNMKKITKKKTNKYLQFSRKTNNVNYRDQRAIINQFNKSIREYKRFIEIYSGGDEELASSKLHDAGTTLYMCCEWALKNYLARRYNEQFESHALSSQMRDYKIEQLSDQTTTLKVLLDELENIAVPHSSFPDSSKNSSHNSYFFQFNYRVHSFSFGDSKLICKLLVISL